MNAARALHERGEAAPGGDPRSFCVRSASVVLKPDEDWVAAARPLVLVRAGQTLTLA
jgi:hypothetical protein